jgi:hypothetical protein
VSGAFAQISPMGKFRDVPPVLADARIEHRRLAPRIGADKQKRLGAFNRRGGNINAGRAIIWTIVSAFPLIGWRHAWLCRQSDLPGKATRSINVRRQRSP